MLERAPGVDAILANCNLMAIAAINHLREHGRRVPEDVPVVGYDDVTLLKLNPPALTTVRWKMVF